MYAMCPLRPTAIATPGATASSIAVLTTLSSLVASEVSRPELLSPISGSTYLIGVGGAATVRAGGGEAQPAKPRKVIAASGAKDFIEFGSGSGICVRRRRKEPWAAAILAVARRSRAHPVMPGQQRAD